MVNYTECDKASYVNLIREHSEDSEAEKDFGERVRTYIDGQKWIRKPFALAPPVCAQYGWKCITSDMLECVTCHAKISVCHPEITKYEAYKACIDGTLKDLKEKHKKHCPWPLTPSSNTLLKIIQMPKEEAL
ncbi:Nuclear-interacting partner of ALK, partial [Stegodyphus mimosarum]